MKTLQQIRVIAKYNIPIQIENQATKDSTFINKNVYTRLEKIKITMNSKIHKNNTKKKNIVLQNTEISSASLRQQILNKKFQKVIFF